MVRGLPFSSGVGTVPSQENFRSTTDGVFKCIFHTNLGFHGEGLYTEVGG